MLPLLPLLTHLLTWWVQWVLHPVELLPAPQWLLLLLVLILASLWSVVFQLAPLASRLSGSKLSGEGRLERAWKAGCWASVVQAGRIGSPNSTPALDLRSRFYAVLAAPGLEHPTIYRSSTSYWRVVGSLRNSPAISHSFPSEIEAKVYLAAAGVVEPDTQP